MQDWQDHLWHPLHAQKTYDALVYLIFTRDFCGFFDSFSLCPGNKAVLQAIRTLFDSIDAIQETWDLNSARPKNYTDPDKDWCILDQYHPPTLGELKIQYRTLLDLPIFGAVTLKDFVTRRLPAEALQTILHTPPQQHRDLLCNVVEAQKQLMTT